MGLEFGLIFGPVGEVFLLLIIRLTLVLVRASALYELLQCSVHQDRDRLSGLLTHSIQLPDPLAVNPRLI